LAAEQTAKACSELSAMAVDLQNLVNQFKLGNLRSVDSPLSESGGTTNMPQQTMPQQTMPQQTMPQQTMPHQTVARRSAPSNKAKAAASGK
jgi:hypothetical protein